MSKSTSLPLIRVAIAVIEQDGRCLVTRRQLDAHLAGFWEFPGGKLREGETARACLARELREELGVGVRVLGRLSTIRFSYPDRRVRLETFRCIIAEGRPRALASQQLRWVGRQTLARLRFPPANRPLIARLTADAVPVAELRRIT